MCLLGDPGRKAAERQGGDAKAGLARPVRMAWGIDPPRLLICGVL